MAEKCGGPGEARFSLIIRGNDLPFEELEKSLALTGARIVRKGEVLNRLPRIEATEDEWVYSVELNNPAGEDEEINALLTDIDLHREALDAIAKTYRVTLRLYVQSDRAQIAYRLMPETLTRLTSTSLPLDVTSLSWGEIGI